MQTRSQLRHSPGYSAAADPHATVVIYFYSIGYTRRQPACALLVSAQRTVSSKRFAAGRLKDEVRRKPAQITKDLEAQLKSTKTVGLRNAIPLSLKDIYKAQGEDEKVLMHLRAMLAENDKALQEGDDK